MKYADTDSSWCYRTKRGNQPITAAVTTLLPTLYEEDVVHGVALL